MSSTPTGNSGSRCSERSAADGAGASSLADDTFDRMLRTDADHAVRCLAALSAVEPAPVLERAIRDELDLLRQRVLALAVRYGPDAIRPAALGLAGRTRAAERWPSRSWRSSSRGTRRHLLYPWCERTFPRPNASACCNDR
jgi:hypothetical protein